MKLATIIYSRDRAMQLHACLSSLKKYSMDYDYANIFVLCKTCEKHLHQYQILFKEFPEVSFVMETELMSQTYAILKEHDAVLFVVDDTLFYRPFNLEACVNLLFNTPKAIGFSLRLGYNVNRSHISKTTIKHPKEWIKIKGPEKFTQLRWPKEQRDFGYPIEVSSSIYRTKDIMPLLKQIPRGGDPGNIEGGFSKRCGPIRKTHPYLLCYETSVAFAAPVNIVRERTTCPFGRTYPATTDTLFDLFEQGKRIDVSPPIEEINACHVEVKYRFV